MSIKDLFGGCFDQLPVLITGHTGFKGSWLTIWLKEMGARVIGFSLPEPPTMPSNYEIARVGQNITDVRGDIRNYKSLRNTILKHQPALVIHFAAQTTVLPSYQDPKTSFDTNVGGTVNLLEAVRTTGSVRAVVVCATDKVYENQEWDWGYRENDRLGGFDPYSSGKAMAELAVQSYRRSFFSGTGNAAGFRTPIGTVRAGNVIGGGDFTEHGLLADSMRALLDGQPIPLRNPASTRPWLYVLDPLSGYLRLAAKLLQSEGDRYAEAWNFGPMQHKGVTTKDLVEGIIKNWGSGSWMQVKSDEDSSQTDPHEARYLHLNWDKAAARLNWRPVYDIEEALSEAVKWFKYFECKADVYEVCLDSIHRYIQKASNLQLDWADGRKS